MDVMPSMNSSAGVSPAMNLVTATGTGANAGQAAAFGAALSAAEVAVGGQSGVVGPEGGQAPATGAGGAPPAPGDAEALDQAALSAMLGMTGAVEVRRPVLTSLQTHAKSGGAGALVRGGLLGAASAAPLAAAGLAALTGALQGPPGEGGGARAALDALQGAGAQQAFTQQLAQMLATRTGPLPTFGGTANTSTPESVTLGGRGARATDGESADGLDDGDAALELDVDAVEGAETTVALTLSAEAQRVKAEADLAAALGGQRGAHAKLGHMGEGATPGQLFTPTQAPVSTTPAAPLSTYVSTLPALPEGVSESAVLRQIDDGLRMVTEGGRTAAEIRLEPAELGKMHVRLELEGAQARLYVTTEHAGVRDLVAQGLDQLRRDLLAQGLHSVHVEVRQQDQRSGQGRRDERRPDEDGAVVLDDGVAEATPALRSLSGRGGGARGRLDLTA